MSRVRIQFPEKIFFETSISVTIDHLNYGNHVGNDKFLCFAHEARLRYFKSILQDELNFFGTSLIMSDAEVSYKFQAFYADTIRVEISALKANSKSFEMFYRMKNQDNKLICLVKSGMVYYDYKTKKVTNAPSEWLALLG